VANGSVVAFDVGILLRISRLDVEESNAQLLGPLLQHADDVFGTGIAPDRDGLTAPFDGPLQTANYTRGRQRYVDLSRRSLPIETIQHVQHPEAAPVGRLVVHEIH
jgi:hypothetical protein